MDPRRLFIDCGAHRGSSVRFFRQVHPQAELYTIYSFEANPQFNACFEGLPDVHYRNAAVWTRDGEITFYSNGGGASTVIAGKAAAGGFRDRPLTVPCLDLSRWLRRECLREDYIILKMDIEGAEYAVLEKLIQDRTIDYIDRLYMEWHCAKTGGDIPIERHLDVLEALVERGLIPYRWAAAEALAAAAKGDLSRLDPGLLRQPATTGREGKLIPPHLEERYRSIQKRVGLHQVLEARLRLAAWSGRGGAERRNAPARPEPAL